MSNLQAALDFNDRTGAWLFPILRYDPAPRFPFKWGEEGNHSNSPEQLKAWDKKYPGCAFAIHLGASGMVVVDVDDKGDGKVDGTATIERLVAEGRDIPEDTLTVSTPSGNGYHLYYWGECKSDNKGIVGESIDIKGGVGYVPAPGQVVQGKGTYSLQGKQTSMRSLPDWIPALVGAPKPKKDRSDEESNVEPDQPHNIAAISGYLANQAESLIEGSRDNTTYQVACKVRDRAISMEMCEQLMLNIWLPKQTMAGDWDADDVCAKIESAYERAAGAFGNADLSQHFSDATAYNEAGGGVSTTEEKVRIPYLEKLENASTFNSMLNPQAIPKREWLMHGRFLTGFVTVTISPGGMGKSTLSMLEGLAVNQGKGEEWLGRKTYQSGVGVWVYNLEDPQDELDRKVAAMAQHFDIPYEDLDNFVTTSGLTQGLTICREGRNGVEINTRALKACEDFIEKHGIKLWIIDPLVKAHHVNENDNGAMDTVMTALSGIAMRQKCSIHLVHHTRKKGKDNGDGDAETARGASSVTSAARVAHTINGMSDQKATQYGLQEDASWYMRLDDAKSNMTPPQDKATWFKKVSVQLPSGDWVGVLDIVDLTEQIENVPFNQQVKDEVIDILAEGITPLQHVASAIALKEELLKDDGTPLTNIGVRKAIERVFTNPVDRRGYLVSIGHGKRGGHKFSKRTTLWLECTKSDELLQAEELARAKASKKDG